MHHGTAYLHSSIDLFWAEDILAAKVNKKIVSLLMLSYLPPSPLHILYTVQCILYKYCIVYCKVWERKVTNIGVLYNDNRFFLMYSRCKFVKGLLFKVLNVQFVSFQFSQDPDPDLWEKNHGTKLDKWLHNQADTMGMSFVGG